jgi:hypothetical protein
MKVGSPPSLKHNQPGKDVGSPQGSSTPVNNPQHSLRIPTDFALDEDNLATAKLS